MPDTGNAKDYLELPPTTFSIFTLKNVTWRTYLISFTVQYCFLFRFVCIKLVSLIWFLQIWVSIYVYGTMINWSTLVKKLMQTYIVQVSGSILHISTVHLNGIWHLIWCYPSKPVLGGHPALSGHYSIPRGCPLNTGFIVFCQSRAWPLNLSRFYFHVHFKFETAHDKAARITQNTYCIVIKLVKWHETRYTPFLYVFVNC